jgi:hypothetical protein
MRTGWQRRLVATAVASALAAAAGCGSTTTPTTPSVTQPATTTDDFTGSIGQTGTEDHVFTVAANGTVTITLTSVQPLATMSLGVAAMTSDGTNCLTQISTTTDARAGSVALKGTATTGNYCVRIYDSGNVPTGTTVAYTVEVLHP